MNSKALVFFKKILASGYISREKEPTVFSYYDESDVREELDEMKEVLDFEFYRTRSRIYLIPNQTNELFLQGNEEFRHSVGTGARLADIYLINFIGIFILNIFFGGSGDNPQVRDFIRIDDLISEFTGYCEQVQAESEKMDSASQIYSLDFIKLAESWLAKTGEDNNSFDSKYGCMNKVLRKFRDEELLKSDRIEPTEKLKDLMPFFLNQSRVNEINALLNGGNKNADDK